MKYYIIRANHAVPVGYYRFIHVGYIFEGPVAEPDDIGMVKVRVRCKEHLAAIKFIIYFFSIYVHHCMLIIWLPIAHQTEMTEEYHKGDCHKWA